MRISILTLWAMAACPLLACAQTVYVTDTLRLGLHRSQDASDPPFDNLVSGTALEVLERSAGYARVRTAAGQEGWVRSAYLVSEKPAQLRVAELEAELERLAAQLEAARTAPGAAAVDADRRTVPAPAAGAPPDAALERLEGENARYAAELDAYRGALPVPWVVGALAVALLAGFLAGWWGLDAAIRRRHGGFRVW